jgi:hypothetical protein
MKGLTIVIYGLKGMIVKDTMKERRRVKDVVTIIIGGKDI